MSTPQVYRNESFDLLKSGIESSEERHVAALAVHLVQEGSLVGKDVFSLLFWAKNLRKGRRESKPFDTRLCISLIRARIQEHQSDVRFPFQRNARIKQFLDQMQEKFKA